MPLTKSDLEQLREFDGALLANTLGYVDPTPAHELYMAGDIQPVTHGIGPHVGIAFTCVCDSSSPGGKADAAIYWDTLKAMQDSGLPSIWVVQCVGSRPKHETVIGDGMAKTLHSVGCVALVTDGQVRDAAGLMTTPFGAYCRGLTIHHTALRFAKYQQPVEVGGLTIHPGDIIHASAEGVIRVPKPSLATLPEKASQMRAFEHDAHRVLRRTDLSIDQKKAEVGKLLGVYGFSDCVTK